MADKMCSAELELLRAENSFLKRQLAEHERGSSLFLILTACLAMNVLVAVIALRQDILRVWRHYEYIFLPPSTEPQRRAMRIHDYFNLLVLPGVVFLDFCFVWEGSSAMKMDDNPTFWRFLQYTIAYFTVDMLWVAYEPNCVKSATTILVHHAVTLLYMAIPVFNPQGRYAMGVCLAVEVNTWFLILRRQPMFLGKSVYRPFVSIPFYVTWFVIRCGIYPYMIFEMIHLFRLHVEKMKDANDPAYERASYGLTYMAIPIIFQTLLSLLNVHWTVQLIKQKMRGKDPDKGL